MSPSTLRLLTVACAFAATLAGPLPAGAQATAILLDSQAGDYIGQGLKQTITPADGTFTATKNFDNGVSVSFNGSASFWFLDFAAPQDALLAPGSYDLATRFPFQAPTVPGLSVAGDGRGCNTLTGRFTVEQIVYGAGSDITAFAASFEQHCEGQGPALFGSVRFNADVPAPPGEPFGLGAVVQQGVARFAWTPSFVGGTAATFRLEAGLTPGATAVTFNTPGATASFDLPGVPPGRYFLRVRGVNQYGVGAASDDYVLTVTGAGLNAPGPPRDVVTTMSGRTVAVSWNPPSPTGPLTSYVLEVGSATGASNYGVVALGLNQSFTAAAVPDGFYFVRLRAQNAAGIGAPSPEQLLVVGGVPAPPDAPNPLTGSVSGSTVSLRWTQGPYGGLPQRYRLEVGSLPGLSDLGSFDTGSTLTAIGFPGVPPGRYYVRVRGVNSRGAGPASNDVRLIVP